MQQQWNTPEDLEYKSLIGTEAGQMDVESSANVLQKYCHGIAKECGWWNKERPTPELIALCHSELSEALEGDRKNLMDDHLPHRKMVEVELADVLIRVFDMAGGLRLDVAGAMAEKMAYNTKRNDHKPEVRADGGKAY